MNITNVRIRINERTDSKLRGVAAITIDDCFVVHDIKVVEGQEGLFIAMPSKKANDGSNKDVAHPINTETRRMLNEVVIAAYNDALAAKNNGEEE